MAQVAQGSCEGENACIGNTGAVAESKQSTLPHW